MQKPAQTPVIQAANITKTFVSGDVKVHALRGITLVVQPGEYPRHHGILWIRQVHAYVDPRLSRAAHKRSLFLRGG